MGNTPAGRASRGHPKMKIAVRRTHQIQIFFSALFNASLVSSLATAVFCRQTHTAVVPGPARISTGYMRWCRKAQGCSQLSDLVWCSARNQTMCWDMQTEQRTGMYLCWHEHMTRTRRPETMCGGTGVISRVRQPRAAPENPYSSRNICSAVGQYATLTCRCAMLLLPWHAFNKGTELTVSTA